MPQEPIVTQIIAAIDPHAEAMRVAVEAVVNPFISGGGNPTRQYEATIDAYNTVIASLDNFRHIEAIGEDLPPTPGFGTGLEDD